MKKNRSQGFTLIELLIVVAIIGILAAIAIPNFLQAQVRAKVSRTQADLRNLANAIELYRQDNNSYPLMGLIDQNVGLAVDPWVGTAGSGTWEQFLAMGIITTPIDYITREPWDPFHLTPLHNNLASNRYCYSSNDAYLSSSATLHMLELAFGAWRVWGSGPDYDRRTSTCAPHRRPQLCMTPLTARSAMATSTAPRRAPMAAGSSFQASWNK